MRKRRGVILLLLLTAAVTFVMLAGTKVFAQQLPKIHMTGSINGIIFPSLDDAGNPVENEFLNDGDLVVAYVDDGYLIGKGEWQEFYYTGKLGGRWYADSLEGLSFVAYNHEADSRAPEIRTGAYHQEHIYTAVYKDGAFYKLKHKEIRAAPMNVVRVEEFTITDESVEIRQIPYLTWLYSQCPVMKVTQLDAGTVTVGDEVIINAFRPEFQRGYDFIVSEGSGHVYRDGYYTWRYRTGRGDAERGYVSLIVKTVPYPGCDEDQVLIPCKITMEAVNDQATYDELTKSQWRSMMRYYLDVSKHGNTVNVSYQKKHARYPDKAMPVMKLEFFCGTRFKPPRLKEDRIIYDSRPSESFTIPDGYDRGYIRATSVFHGYTWNFRF